MLMRPAHDCPDCPDYPLSHEPSTQLGHLSPLSRSESPPASVVALCALQLLMPRALMQIECNARRQLILITMQQMLLIR